MRRSFSTSLMALLWIGGSSAFADSEITRHVFSAGGGTATSAHHSVRATLGQPTAGNASSFHHDVGSGFWAGQSESVLGDMNCDG
ncbi:MAG: hypothetical protein JNG88_16585, partial [Phycisphaerales bacterium]|nr:hypothetical protein [Phycisphaerales bacterium]